MTCHTIVTPLRAHYLLTRAGLIANTVAIASLRHAGTNSALCMHIEILTTAAYSNRPNSPPACTSACDRDEIRTEFDRGIPGIECNSITRYDVYVGTYLDDRRELRRASLVSSQRRGYLRRVCRECKQEFREV